MIPRLSVITTCKNHAEFLSETLDSILSQTFEDFEICITDGGSTDGSVDILKDYAAKDSRVRWISEEDNGVDEGLWKSLQRSRGEYVALIAVSDFYLSKTWFETAIAILDRQEEISLVHGNIIFFSEEKGFFMNEASRCDEFLNRQQPSGQERLSYMLGTGVRAKDCTTIARKDVYLKCYPSYSESYNQKNALQALEEGKDSEEWFLPYAISASHVSYSMLFKGYMLYHVPSIVSVVRRETGAISQRFSTLFGKLMDDDLVRYLDKFLDDLVSGRKKYFFRNGYGEIVGEVAEADLPALERKALFYRAQVQRMVFRHPINMHQSGNYGEIKTLAQRLKEFYAKKTKGDVYIFGAGAHTIQLLSELRDSIAFKGIVVSDKTVDQFLGFPVYDIKNVNFSCNDVVVISSRVFQEEIYTMLRNDYGLLSQRLVTLYPDVTEGNRE